MPTVADAIRILRGRRRILVFTGAGISTESGIPDFRGPDGVWTKVDPADFTLDRYLASPEVRLRSWSHRGALLDAEPNAAHHAVARMFREGLMIGCVTQNIDGLHLAAGLPANALVEIHGTVATTSCLECGESYPTGDILEGFDGSEPRCSKCEGILKVDTVFFGEAMPPTAMDRALDWAGAADAVLAVGTTLSVYPAAQVPLEALDRGARFVIINRGATEQDHLADVVIDAGAGDALEEIASSLSRD